MSKSAVLERAAVVGDGASGSIGQTIAEDMAKYGITRVPIDYYYYKEYRYTNVEDAIAQAKRQHPGVPI